MLAILISRAARSRTLRADLLIVVCLLGLDVAARLLPHPPDFTPVAASALFAASVLRVRFLAALVPIVAMIAGDAMLGLYDPRLMIVVYAALALPACAAFLPRRLRRLRAIVPVLLSCSLIFFVLTNFAVWAFSPMYPGSVTGLVRCYIAGLPFLRNMLAGDLCWGLVLFGLHGLAQNAQAAHGETLTRRPAAA